MENQETKFNEFDLLIVSFLTGEIRSEEKERLLNWIQESEINKKYFNELRNTWILSSATAYPVEFDNDQSWKKLKAKTRGEEQAGKNRVRGPVFSWIHVAAACLIFFILGSAAVMVFNADKKPERSVNAITEIVCPYGSKSQIFLPDGSDLWLNAGSKIRYNSDFGLNGRSVELSGEAFFNVATDRNNPFIVTTGRMVVRAYGTRFNVKCYPDEDSGSATLEEGEIDVEVRHADSKTDNYKLKPNDRIVLIGEKAVISNISDIQAAGTEKAKIEPLSVDLRNNIKTELYTSWKDERWLIEKEPLESLIPLLERRYNLKFHFESDELRNFKFTGTIQNETIEQILEALRLTAPLTYKIIMDSITLSYDEKYAEQFRRVTTRN